MEVEHDPNSVSAANSVQEQPPDDHQPSSDHVSTINQPILEPTSEQETTKPVETRSEHDTFKMPTLDLNSAFSINIAFSKENNESMTSKLSKTPNQSKPRPSRKAKKTTDTNSQISDQTDTNDDDDLSTNYDSASSNHSLSTKRKYIKRKNPENDMDEVRSRMEALESDNKILRSTISEMKSQMITDSRYYNQRITEVQTLITTHISRANSAMEEQATSTANAMAQALSATESAAKAADSFANATASISQPNLSASQLANQNPKWASLVANLTSSNDPIIFKQIPKPAAPVEISEQMIAEIRDRENRKLNVMVFGLPLSKTAKSDKEQEYYDYDYIDEMCWQLDINQKCITKARRFKLRNDNTSCPPIMLTMTDAESHRNIIRLARYKLRSNKNFQNVYLSPDKTDYERLQRRNELDNRPKKSSINHENTNSNHNVNETPNAQAGTSSSQTNIGPMQDNHVEMAADEEETTNPVVASSS